MFDSLFNLPLVVVGTAIVVLLCAFALSGLAIFSRHILPRLKLGPEESVFTSAMMQAVMVFYGLAVALIAVSVWQTHTDAGATISGEASALGVLYRHVGGYPEPLRSKVKDFEAGLVTFEPATEGQKLLHAETLRAYSQMIEARRLRLDAVLTGLPGVLWFVIVIGALVSLSSTFFFQVEDTRLQRIQVVLLALFVGLIIFIIFALDRPFRGDLGLQPDAYQLIYDQLMKR